MWFVGSWASFDNFLKTLPARFEKQKLVALRVVAKEFQKMWREEIEGNTPPENNMLTMMSKTGDTTLYDSGGMSRKIKVHNIASGTVFTGIQKDEVLRNGQNAAIVASANEYGTGPRKPKNKQWLSIPLTKKAKIAGSPTAFPGMLVWVTMTADTADVDIMDISALEGGMYGVHFWVDENRQPQYLNVKNIGPIPSRPAFRNTFEKFRIIGPEIYDRVMRQVFQRGERGWKL